MPVSKMKMRKGKEMEIKSNGRADMFKDRGQDKVNSSQFDSIGNASL